MIVADVVQMLLNCPQNLPISIDAHPHGSSDPNGVLWDKASHEVFITSYGPGMPSGFRIVND